jgi:hypothetical protein
MTDAEIIRFPRAGLVLNMVALAEAFRAAAIELEELSGSSHAYEIGTLRRKVRAVLVQLHAELEASL